MATDYLKLFSVVALGHMWIKAEAVARLRLAENPEGRAFYEAKLSTARFYSDRILPLARALSRVAGHGASSLMALAPENFAHGQTTIGQKSWEKPQLPAGGAAARKAA